MPQALEDWLGSLQKRIDRLGHSRDDLEQVIYACADMLQAMRPAYDEVRRQFGALTNIQTNYTQVYMSRFGEPPPDRPHDQQAATAVLETTEQRRDAIRKTAIRIASPNSNTTDREVLQALKSEGIELGAGNPRATISTVLNGFKEEFEKVKGKRGEFRRRGPAETIQHTIAT